VKTLLLMNILGQDNAATCDFDYPPPLLYYMASESVAYDVIITIVTALPLYKHMVEMKNTGHKADIKITRLVRIILGINITNVLVFILLVSIAETVGYYDETPILMVLNNYWYLISTWFPNMLATINSVFGFYSSADASPIPSTNFTQTQRQSEQSTKSTNEEVEPTKWKKELKTEPVVVVDDNHSTP